MQIKIHFKDMPPAATEKVFPSHLDRSLNNCYRFTLEAYMHYKGFSFKDYLKNSTRAYAAIRNMHGISYAPTGYINLDETKDICNFFGVQFEYLIAIAKEFQKHEKYNCLNFHENGDVVFFKAIKVNFGAA